MALSTAIVFVRGARQIKTKWEITEIVLCAAVDTAGHQLALHACAVGRSGSGMKRDEGAAWTSALHYVASDVGGFHVTQLCNNFL